MKLEAIHFTPIAAIYLTGPEIDTLHQHCVVGTQALDIVASMRQRFGTGENAVTAATTKCLTEDECHTIIEAIKDSLHGNEILVKLHAIANELERFSHLKTTVRLPIN